ncbi:universal stress protein [Haloferula rosea]|uniref:Universal stress protein n=1 Tax=Haloferula rosea TaxID=490093 RepID=A0A934VAZ4_9BACT|nr:universal stress protein [Haloferula rosea]MBK1826848.1 universal stress protein [Haloferula rosea]
MKKIIAAVDFSDSTQGVVEMASAQAQAFGAELHLVHVLEPEPAYTAYGFTPDEFPAMHVFQEEARKRATKRLEELAAGTPGASSRLAEGSPMAAISDYVKETDADLVVLGSHGHGMVASLLLGSVAEGMVRKALVPTLVVPAPEK